MITEDGTKLWCTETGKICYTVREAGTIINGTKSHHLGHNYCNKTERPKRRYWCSFCGYYHLTHWSSYPIDKAGVS